MTQALYAHMNNKTIKTNKNRKKKEDQKSNVLLYMRTLDLAQMQQCGWTGIT
jgi:hypothetical protein